MPTAAGATSQPSDSNAIAARRAQQTERVVDTARGPSHENQSQRAIMHRQFCKHVTRAEIEAARLAREAPPAICGRSTIQPTSTSAR